MSQSIAHKDGRRFGFAEWGHPNSQPVVLFVGGSSRVVHPLVESPAIRLITVDRPGLGLSDFQPNRTLLDLPDDILQLVDTLGLRKFAVVGISQGGPSALACAYKLPQRLVAVSVVSSLAPLPSPASQRRSLGAVATFARLANDYPLALKFQSALAAWMVRLNPRWTFRQVLKSLPQSDRAIFDAHPDLVAMFVSDLTETNPKVAEAAHKKRFSPIVHGAFVWKIFARRSMSGMAKTISLYPLRWGVPWLAPYRIAKRHISRMKAILWD